MKIDTLDPIFDKTDDWVPVIEIKTRSQIRKQRKKCIISFDLAATLMSVLAVIAVVTVNLPMWASELILIISAGIFVGAVALEESE